MVARARIRILYTYSVCNRFKMYNKRKRTFDIDINYSVNSLQINWKKSIILSNLFAFNIIQYAARGSDFRPFALKFLEADYII